MREGTIKEYTVTNDEAALYPFGWEQTDDGSEFIRNNPFLNFDHGLGYSLYWGNNTNEEWLQKHLDRDVTYGWRSPKAKMDRFLSLDIQPPTFADCEMTFVLDRAYADMEELNAYYTDVSVKINQNSLLVFSTTSEEFCGLIVNVRMQSKYFSSFIELDAMHPYRLFADGDLYWRCVTDIVNSSKGRKCNYNTRWNEFKPENYSSEYETENHSPIYLATGEKDANPSPNPFKNIKDIVKYVGIGIAAVVAVIIKAIAALKVSKSMMSNGFVGRGRREEDDE